MASLKPPSLVALDGDHTATCSGASSWPLERRDAVWQPQQADGGADPGALTALASAQPGISELCRGGSMGRRIPRDLRNIGWSFLFFCRRSSSRRAGGWERVLGAASRRRSHRRRGQSG
jgi:hypothetical protein